MDLVPTQPTSLDAYRGIVHDELCNEIEQLAAPIRGLRVHHINATPNGGGVAEILRALVPLMTGVGLEARWYTLAPDNQFFGVTKRIHNMLQGESDGLTDTELRIYLAHNERTAREMAEVETDIWIVHDPQPLPVLSIAPELKPAIWRCHIDTSRPNPTLAALLLPYIQAYDQQVFTLPEFVFPELSRETVTFISPAIDPLSGKNIPIDRDIARRILHKLGVDPNRPLVTQVSRFDPWKDPIGVVDAFRLARQQIPDLQLAMVGVMTAKDDPQQMSICSEVARHAGDDPDIHLYTEPRQVGDIEINAFQTASDVIVQKSIREGFGLTVTEAMWKGNPVIGGRAGGVAVQIRHGTDGFLVSSVEECAHYIVQLVRDRDLAQRMGDAARDRARHHYMMPALLRDYLRLLGDLVRLREAA